MARYTGPKSRIARRGQGVVEWAFAEGRNAAVECAEYLHALKK